MKVKVIGKINFEDLVERVRKVPLMKSDKEGNPIHVYKKADISLRTLHPEEVNPTTFYLLKKSLDFQRELRKQLMSEYGVDTLNLDCALELKNEKGEIWTLTPPIIEVISRKVIYHPSDGEIKHTGAYSIKIPVINDGAHRIYLAREEGISFKGLFISNVAESHPFYAHPNEWNKVKIFDDTPKTKREKKLYSREDNYALYRNFGILGCGEPRGVSK